MTSNYLEVSLNTDNKRKKALLKSLESCAWVITKACERAGVSRTTFYEWSKTDVRFQKSLKEIQEKRKKKLLEILEKTRGIVTTACKMAKLSKNTYYEWYKSDENFRKKAELISEVGLDMAESQLHKLIDQGCVPAVIFYLKTKGKHRGFVEKSIVQNETGSKKDKLSWLNNDEKEIEKRKDDVEDGLNPYDVEDEQLDSQGLDESEDEDDEEDNDEDDDEDDESNTEPESYNFDIKGY